MVFKGKLDKVLPPIGVFPRLMMQDDVTTESGEAVNQRVIFLINPDEAAMLQGIAPGTDLEVDAPGLGDPNMGIKSYSVKIV